MREPLSFDSDYCKRILILTSDLGGGTGHHLLSIVRHWNQTKWQVKIICTSPPSLRDSPCVPIHYLPPSRTFPFYPFAQIRYLTQIYAEMKDNLPDIVHTYFFWSIIYGRLLKLAGKIKVLIENREDQGFSWGLHEYAWLRATNFVPDRVICVSEAVRQVVLERERMNESRTVVIKNGIVPIQGRTGDHVATRQELGIDETSLVVGMVANYNRPIKGVSFFLDAIPLIVKEIPSARFLLVGGGDEEHSLRSKAREMGIEPFIIFAGKKKDIHRYYEIMNISALSSLSEGLSITVLESMGHGLPVVVTRVGGNPEVVIDGQTGYLVPPKDRNSIARRIIELLLNPDLRIKMGMEGRKRVEQHFQVRDVSKRYLEVYENLIPSVS